MVVNTEEIFKEDRPPQKKVVLLYEPCDRTLLDVGDCVNACLWKMSSGQALVGAESLMQEDEKVWMILNLL